MEPANREHAWTLQDIGKNGIAGILKDNNSILKTLENISINPINNSTNIKKVKIYELESYLNSIQAEHDKYLCNRVVGLSAAVEGSADLVNLDSNDTFNSLEEWTARLAMAGSFVANELPPLRSNSRSKTSNSNSPKKDKSPNKPKMYSGNAPPLHNVPGIYFDEEFSLGNPRVFSTVVEYLDLKSNNSDSFTSQRILQEKLSHYLDIVEIHLMKEISIKSSGFFSALQNLQILQQETKSCIQRISELQDKLKDLSQNQVKKGLEIVKLHRERGNCTLLLECKSINL